ncbi:hypothetical protein MKX01_024448 [Papaver californicum]|nr:hypothetical protein MKX01_024448 [Papaver californicum]
MTRGCDSEMASTSGFDDEMLGNYDGFNILSLSSLAPGISNKMNNQEKGKMIQGRSEGGGESCDRLPSNCRGGMGSFQSYAKSGSSLRSRRARGFSAKPLSSLESCLAAQLYKEHVEMEEYVFSTFPSPSRQTVRPLVVTDGARVISRASRDSYSVHLESGESMLHNGFNVNGRDVVLGVPPVPQIGPLEMKQKRAKGRVGKLSSCKTNVVGKNFMSQVSSGSANGMFIFCLGITVGVMSTVVANKREVDKLHGLLKQTENLVQDLQEELEMKDSLTVKELPNEDDESQETNDHSFHNVGLTSFSSELSSLNYGDKRSDTQKLELEENSEMMKIEAELEAELERLELNMQASSLEGRLYGHDELDPDLVGNIVQGELRPDMLKGGAAFRADSDKDASGTSTTQTENVNYAVSPRTLSLRLHEIIQSRLEGRIEELESELQNSQKIVTLMEYKQQRSLQRNYSNGGPRSSSQESLTLLDEDNSIAQPLVLNLSGNALDSYNESYKELLGVPLTDEEEEHTPLTVHYENQINNKRLHWERNFFSNWNGTEENGSFQQVKVIKERYPTPMSSFSDKRKTLERFSNEVGEFEEESGDDDYDDDDGDEMGRLLIQKIVEKTKRGSSLVLNAQKLLFSLDDKV